MTRVNSLLLSIEFFFEIKPTYMESISPTDSLIAGDDLEQEEPLLFSQESKSIRTAHGTVPQFLIEKIIRERIYESLYWREHCFGLNAATLCDPAVGLKAIGGLYGNQIPTPFLCLLLKLLQIRPSWDIVQEYMHQEDFKYLRVMGAMYWRLTAPAVEVYKELEPLLLDFRKIRMRLMDGSYTLTFVDEFIESLLYEDRVCGTSLPRLTKREVLEEQGLLEPRESPLENFIDDEDEEEELEKEESVEQEEEEVLNGHSNGEAHAESRRNSSPSPIREKLGGKLKLKPQKSKNSTENDDRHERYHSRSRSRDRSRDRDSSRRYRDRSRSRDRYTSSRRDRSTSRNRDRYRSKRHDRSRSRDGRREDGHDRHRSRQHSRDRYRSSSRYRRHQRDRSLDRSRQDRSRRRSPSREKRRPTEPTSKPKGSADSLSIEETNRIRISLGMKPLEP